MSEQFTEKQNEIFNFLFTLDVNNHVEKKKTGSVQLSYLSWAWAWSEVKKKFPTAEYEIEKFDNSLPYVFDPWIYGFYESHNRRTDTRNVVASDGRG